MLALHPAPTTILRDNEGYLLYPEDWSERLAEMLAKEVGVIWDEEHQTIVSFVRNYYDETSTVPEARKVLGFMKERWGQEKGTRKYLYHLFPRGYAQQACKIAGMRKPLKLMLDV